MQFLDGNVSVFKELYRQLNISYNQFIRTTDQTLHYPGAKKLWAQLEKSGDLYKQSYTGLYCSGCEAFKTEKELENLGLVKIISDKSVIAVEWADRVMDIVRGYNEEAVIIWIKIKYGKAENDRIISWGVL